MPARYIPTASGLLGSVLIVSGIMMTIIGVGLTFADTGGVKAGLEWMLGPATGTIIGVSWLCLGGLVTVCGIFSKKQHLETLGTVAAVVWPLVTAGLFFIAQFTGEVDTAWTQAIRFFTIPALVFTVAISPDRHGIPKSSESRFRDEGGKQ